jgi:hypothetical protein
VIFRLIPLFLLSGCQLYGGAYIHDKAMDSEFKQERLITTFGMSEDINKNLEIYIEHESQPLYDEKGYGLNKLGFKLKTKL